MATPPLKHNYQGFTMIEMVAVLLIISIVAGFTIPSFMTFNKPLREGVSKFRGQISLVRSKAIASNRSYRIRPFSSTKFTVEYATNCRVSDANWTRATQFDIDLPKNVRITDVASTTLVVPGSGTSTFNSGTSWNICFDSRGIAAIPTGSSAPPSVILKDFKGDSKAKIALFNITLVGGIDVVTYDRNNNPIIQDSYDSYSGSGSAGQVY